MHQSNQIHKSTIIIYNQHRMYGLFENFFKGYRLLIDEWEKNYSLLYNTNKMG